MPSKTRRNKNKSRKFKIGKKKGGVGDNARFTVGELRQSLQGVADDMPVYCGSHPSVYEADSAGVEKLSGDDIFVVEGNF